MFKRSSTSKNAPLFMIFILLVGVAFFLSFIKSNDPAAQFRLGEKPIHPLCLSQAVDLYRSGDSEALDLTQCPQETPPVLQPDGMLYTDNPVDPDFPEIYAGYSSYRVIGKSGDLFIVLHSWNGGGSGHFSYLYGVRFSPPLLKLETHYESGDRCNGGVVSARVEGESLIFQQNATPADFFNLTGKTYPKIPELEYCPVCCAGIVETSLNLKTSVVALLGLAIGPERRSAPQDAADGAQTCFNKIYDAYLDKGFSLLDKDQIVAFNDAVIEECVSSEGRE